MARVYDGTGTKIARLPGVQPLLDAAAAAIRAKAQANASTRFKTGRYSQAFEVETVPGRSGVMDRIVVNTHPAAAAIEFGHFAESADGTTGEWVPGQFNLTRAVG